MSIAFRLLNVETEWPLIAHEFTSRGVSLPDPRFAQIMGAFNTDTNTLYGFLVCQMQFHLEPIVLYNPLVLRGLVKHMEKDLEEKLGHPAQYFAFAGHPDIAGACEAMGMKKVEEPIYYKQYT
jgi:hypothetical protein